MKGFLYYILKKDGRSGKVVNNVVTYSGQPSPLPQTPDGWQEIVLAWERSAEKHSVENTGSLPLSYVRDAMHILREAVYNRTVQEELYLLIQKLTLVIDNLTYKWVYKFFYKGKLDLIELEDQQDAMDVPVIETDLHQLIKSNEQKDYSYPMLDPDVVYLKADGVEIENTIVAILDNGSSDDGGFYFKNHIVGLDLITAEVGFIGAAKETERTQVSNSNPSIRATTQYVLKATVAGTVTVEYSIDFTMEFTPGAPGLNPAAIFKIVLRRIDESGISSLQEELFSRAAGLGFNGSFHADGSFTMPVDVGDELYLFAFCNVEGSDGDDQIRILYVINDDTLFKISFAYVHPTTYIKCFRRMDLWKKLIKSATGDENNAVSDLCTENDSLLITCGDAIRGLADPVLKTNIKDFFKDNDATFMAGLDITGGKVELEDRLKYYDQSDEYDLGLVKNLVKRPAKELLANTFRFGHPKQQTEAINGKYDPNGNNLFEGPLTVINKEYNMVSPYKVGPYEIEMLRINLSGKTTTDDKTDSDIFVIAALGSVSLDVEVTFSHTSFLGIDIDAILVPDGSKFHVGQQIRITLSTLNNIVMDVIGISTGVGVDIIFVSQTVVDEGPVNVNIEWLSGAVYELNRPAYTTLENAPPSIFNLPYLTPKTMALRHLRWMSSINYGLQKLKFINAKENYNSELKTVLGSVTVDEDKDENFSDPMWLPWWFIFEKDSPVNLPEILETHRNKVFKFTDENGDIWKGFLWIAGIAPNDFSPQEYRLLATPDNDLTKLIHG